ncbi:MAG: glycosyltransferase [Rhizobiaceae bacterium]
MAPIGTAAEPNRRRILEIGENGLFYFAMPEVTEAIYASYRADLRRDRPYLGFGALLRIARGVRNGNYDLVVLHPTQHAGWHPRSFLAAMRFSLLRGRFGEIWGALTSPLFLSALRFVRLPTMVAIDRGDAFSIPRHSFWMLDRARAFFKRELPSDHWRVFYASAHRRLPGLSFRKRPRWIRRLSKLRPIGLGLGSFQIEAADRAFGSPKTTDVFFAGAVEGNSTLRADVPRQLELLKAAGFTVDRPERAVPLDEFMQRCAQSWLTLSPEGLGWDCYRHMEAAVCGSVPLVSAPSIHRYRPLVVGEQCLVYHPDEDGIVETVRTALADKARLSAMAASARDHTLAHLTERAICEAIVVEFARGSAQ